jgi:hypothetical protein
LPLLLLRPIGIGSGLFKAGFIFGTLQLGQHLPCRHGLAFPNQHAPDPAAGLKGQIHLRCLDSTRVK